MTADIVSLDVFRLRKLVAASIPASPPPSPDTIRGFRLGERVAFGKQNPLQIGMLMQFMDTDKRGLERAIVMSGGVSHVVEIRDLWKSEG